MLIPEFPGKDLYYTMYYLVRNHYDEFVETSNMVLLEAGAIAMGIILALLRRQTGMEHNRARGAQKRE